MYSINCFEFLSIVFHSKHLITYTFIYVLFTYCKNDKNHQNIQKFWFEGKTGQATGARK
jgi:hypothetical protein